MTSHSGLHSFREAADGLQVVRFSTSTVSQAFTSIDKNSPIAYSYSMKSREMQADYARTHAVHQLPAVIALCILLALNSLTDIGASIFVGMAIVFVYMGFRLAQYGLALGVFFPLSLRKARIAKIDKFAPHAKNVIASWTSNKDHHQTLVNEGLDSVTAFEWLVVLDTIGTIKTKDKLGTVVTMYRVGISPERYHTLWDMGLEDISHFIMVAENDLDSNLVSAMFPMKTDLDRRLSKLHELMEVLS